MTTVDAQMCCLSDTWRAIDVFERMPDAARQAVRKQPLQKQGRDSWAAIAAYMRQLPVYAHYKRRN